jgi:hypothetical protein
MKKILLITLLAACSDGASGGPSNELITTVTLTFTPTGGGTPVVASFKDDDGDGGNPPTVGPVNLTNGASYMLGVQFLNELETPPEDITLEVKDESDTHQVFFTGSAVRGPATSNTTGPLVHSYADTDANGFPIGLANTVAASTGTGMLTVTLRHLPPVNDTAVKTATLADTVKAMGIAALPGDSDVNVTFAVTVP